MFSTLRDIISGKLRPSTTLEMNLSSSICDAARDDDASRRSILIVDNSVEYELCGNGLSGRADVFFVKSIIRDVDQNETEAEL